MKRTIVDLFGMVFVAGAMACYAQSCGPQAVIVDVLNARGLPIPDLPPSSFRASSHGKAAMVLSASLRSDPSARTYVLLDMGESMGGIGAQGIDKWKIARAAASEFLAVAPSQAEISLETFSAEIERKFPSGDGRQAMQDWLNNAESLRASELRGKSAIHRAILETAKAMEPTRAGDSIFVITDGRNDKNFSMASSVADELGVHGIRLFSFVLDDSRHADSGIAAGGLGESAPPPNPGATELSDLVARSGGVGYTLYPGGRRVGQSFGVSYGYDERTHQNVRTSVAEIDITIRYFYILGVSLPEASRGLGDFHLEVVDALGKKRTDVVAAYPAKVPGCAADSGGK